MNEHMNRRELLRAGYLGASAFYLAPGLFAIGNPVGARRSAAAEPAVVGNVLVVVQLSGGNDGLNTVVPFGIDEYNRERNALRLRAEQCIALNDEIGLNGQLAGLKSLFDDGQLAVVQGVGYPQPNRSHFKSMDIWHSGDASNRPKATGWLGRMADICCAESSDADFTINLSQEAPLALTGAKSRPVSFVNPGSYQFRGSRAQMPVFEKMTGDGGGSTGALEFLVETARDARMSSNAIRSHVSDYRTPIEYPQNRLANSLKTVAALIPSDLSTRVYYVYHTGFDTHVNQLGRQNRLLADLDQALTAFQKDLVHGGATDRVTTMVFSEFGRRVAENGSRGTDHGTAGPVFVMGSKIRGGLHGEHPDLSALDGKDMVFTTDFRSVYAGVLQDWMKVDSQAVLGGRFPALSLFTS